MGTDSLRKAVGDILLAKVERRCGALMSCQGTCFVSVFQIPSSTHSLASWTEGLERSTLGPVHSSFFLPTPCPTALNSPATANHLQGFQCILLF